MKETVKMLINNERNCQNVDRGFKSTIVTRVRILGVKLKDNFKITSRVHNCEGNTKNFFFSFQKQQKKRDLENQKCQNICNAIII